MKTKPLVLALTSAAVLLCGPAAPPVSAQMPVPPPMPAYQPLSDQQLDQLLGPIALYPDPLLAQILPAATLPAQIVLADRYLTSGGDPNLADQQPWDPSVQALTHYPTVLQYLDNNLGWTTEVGQTFLNQQQQVMESIQRLRASARNFGNLQSTPQQQVVDDGGDIEILPADPDVVYVPVYQPAYVYFQGGYGLGFGVACTLGPWLDCDFDWNLHHLYFWDRDHPRPANWWHERPDQRHAWVASHGSAWRPEDHRDFATARRGDRGWNNVPATAARPYNAVVNYSHSGAEPRPAATPRPAAEPRPQERPAPERAPAPNAFIGNESSRDAREFSARGHESMQNVTHSEPAPARVESARPEPMHAEPPAAHSAPPAPSGGQFHR